MVKKFKRIALITISVVGIFALNGCSVVEKIEKKLGMKNEYFEYLNTNNVEQISIQSTRDTGFKFIVTEESAIKEMYNLLSRAEVSESKSTLSPDYKIEFDLGDTVKEFYYVVGSEKGNFYDETSIFTVSKRLDEGIMKNLSFIRKPRDFEYIYYNSILGVLKLAKDNGGISDQKIGVNIKGDIDCLKYVFSNDLNNFLKKAEEITPNVQLINNNEGDFDIIVSVKNRGYDSTHFKTLVTIHNKLENTEEKYYIVAINEFKEWNIDIVGPNPQKKPSGW